MPTLQEILNALQFISFEIALLGLFITAGTIVISRDWRLLILALLLQYIVVGLILSRLVRPDIAVLKVMIGAFICPILFLSARQVSAGAGLMAASVRPEASWLDRLLDIADNLLLVAPDRRRKLSPTGVVFRIFLTALLILITVTVSQSFPLTQLSPTVTTAVYWLALAGLITLTLTEDALKAGIGLFILFSGFDIYYAVLESSLLLAGLWGAANLLLALVVGYLVVVRSTGPAEEL